MTFRRKLSGILSSQLIAQSCQSSYEWRSSYLCYLTPAQYIFLRYDTPPLSRMSRHQLNVVELACDLR